MKLLLPILSFLAIPILISCTSADIEDLPQQNTDTSSPSAGNSSSIVGKSSSSTSPSLDEVSCMVNGVCVELSQSACESFLGSQVPSCQVSSSSALMPSSSSNILPNNSSSSNVVLSSSSSSSSIALSSSSSSLKVDNVSCLVGANCAETTQITCNALGGTPVSSCPVSSSSNVLTPSSSSSAQQQQPQSSSSSRPNSSSSSSTLSSSSNNSSTANCQYQPSLCGGKSQAGVIVVDVTNYTIKQGTCAFVKDFGGITNGSSIVINGVDFSNADQVKKENKIDGGYYIYVGHNDGFLTNIVSGNPDQCSYETIKFNNKEDIIAPLTGHVTLLCNIAQCGIECRPDGTSSAPINIGCGDISSSGAFSYITYLSNGQSVNCNIPSGKSIACRAY